MNHASSKSLKEASLSVSPQFKSEAIKSIIAIAGFILVYFILLAISVGIVALCVYGGISVIMLRPAFYTLLIGLGLAGFGIMVFVFLIKFLFASSKEDNSNSIEVMAQDEPKLFQMIYELAKETGTTRPKKVFFTPDVNAAVFYNSSFWSMFLPIRKNLKIGLGLVNTVNISELKAVIAHEFGHFSQSSMKVGSWVYAVNKIIYDMLYNNSGYANSLNSMSQMNGILSFFAACTVKVVQGIQWVLQQMFALVNRSYMGLSRQMEFHADLVAATYCGSNNIISALRRVAFADACYNTTIDLCNEAWKEKKMPADFYAGHSLVVKHLARQNKVLLIDGLPVIEEGPEATVSPRVSVVNQWASHPPLQERSDYLQPFGLTAGITTASAWTIFSNADKWKELLTKQLYHSVPQEEVNGMLEVTEFAQLLTAQDARFSFPSLFKEYYDNRLVPAFDVETVAKEPFRIIPFDELFIEEAALLPKKIEVLSADIAVLQAIIKKEISTRSFDFDGEKFKAADAPRVLAILESELQAKEKELATLDQNLFRYFYAIAPLAEAEALKGAWVLYFSYRGKSDAFIDKINRFMNLLAPVYAGESMAVESIQRIIQNFKTDNENSLKEEWTFWLTTDAFNEDKELEENIRKFIAADYQYFSGNSFFEHELNDLNKLVQESWRSIYYYVFNLFKSITEGQAALQEKRQTAALLETRPHH